MTTSNASAYRALHQDAGTRLFTVMIFDQENELGQRAYTSHPEEYPISGAKPLLENRWYQQVFVNQKTFVANTTPEFSDVFGDHEIINQLGCESAINIPIMDGDQVRGTANFLDVEQYFTPDRVAELETLVERHQSALISAMA